MKRFALCFATTLGLLASSHAADLPNRHRSPDMFSSAPVATWTGFYVGGQVGYGWGSDRSEITVPGFPFTFASRDQDVSGPVGGLHSGYNYQIGLAVFGAEADLEFAGIEGRDRRAGTDLFSGFATSADMKIGFQGSFRGRVGFALLDRMMLYGTAGAAFASVENTYMATLPAGNLFGAPAGSASAKFDEMRWGWTAGVGAEYAVTSNWTARLEYRYTNFTAYKNTVSLLTTDTYSEQDPDFHTFRIGASYRF